MKRCELCNEVTEGAGLAWNIDPRTKGDVCPPCWETVLECLIEYGIQLPEELAYLANPSIGALLVAVNSSSYLPTGTIEDGPVASNLGLLEAFQDEGRDVDEDNQD